MKSYNLIEIVERYPQVIFDNSILDTSGRVSKKETDYYRQLEAVLRSSPNFLTIEDVYQEYKDINSGKQWHEQISQLLKSHIFKSITLLKDYFTLLEEFKTLPNFNLIYEAEKKHPYSDFKLAALALCLAEKGKPAAFLSGDRKLNGFIQFIVDYPSKVLRGKASFDSLDVYSFVLSNPGFILYKDERDFIITPADIRESKKDKKKNLNLEKQVDGLLRCILPPRQEYPPNATIKLNN